MCNAHTKKIEDEACSICFDAITKPATLECKHVFCNGCISEWFSKFKTTCPCCRGAVSDAKIVEITGKPKPVAPTLPRHSMPVAGISPEMRERFRAAVHEPIPEDANRDSLLNVAMVMFDVLANLELVMGHTV